MPTPQHGTPDWGLESGSGQLYRVSDLAELAARLGSIVTFDRRGSVIWLSSFDHGLAEFLTSAPGTGASIAASAARTRRGQYSALLTAGSDTGQTATLTRYLPVPPAAYFGAELSFSLASTISSLQLTIDHFRGAYGTRYRVRWSDTLETLQYLDSNEAWQTLASNVPLLHQSYFFHTMKLVIDPENRQYVRFMLDNDTYAMPGISGFVEASGGLDVGAVFLALTGRPGFNDQVYVDDVILTTEEP